MSYELLATISAGVALAGLMAYAVLGGADFGGGVWDLLATGPRKAMQRRAIADAMGPVWEANHVWLIFVVVVLFTAFPHGYRVLMVALFAPAHLVLIGIVLRGAAFVFRHYGPHDPDPATSGRFAHASVWGAVFGVASLVSPVLLGAAFGVLTSGRVRLDEQGQVVMEAGIPWLSAYPLTCGLLALSTCAYLASVYLVVETEGDLREDFRRRAIFSGTTTAALAAVTLLVARFDAPWFAERLLSREALPVLIAGGVAFVGSAVAVFSRRHYLARWFAGTQTVLMLLGWGIAHRAYFIYPDVTLIEAAGPYNTLAFVLAALPVGAVILVPSLWLLLKVFKTHPRGIKTPT
jgi:cytochrome d ubiquinol oxidase subunit II